MLHFIPIKQNICFIKSNQMAYNKSVLVCDLCAALIEQDTTKKECV